MTHNLKLLTMLLFIFLLIGCRKDTIREPDLTGYVIEATESCILVASSKAKDLSEDGGVSEFYEMIWFNNPPSEINSGDKIDVWYDQVNQSYPAVSKLEEFNIHQEHRPEGASLSQAEALTTVLSELDFHPNERYAIRSILFDKNKLIWNVNLFEVWSEKIISIELPDPLNL
ncbi:Protein of unknown function [Amphibacillus marinus]|uniref:DUF3221 domain-containing protein n=1 Tax=Amphibacillus marinus TaxID=872970 RepID=A0A1H8RCW7_9BACI|nr:DUF3221 domain-containing protein [Amphibacillus marinus]SEO64202.1 Protein of unknown function [Amphibacillus marinus]